ncbi:MAG: YeiH family protein [Alphaproteobacteria bacterium]|nr:YeiH family protein [Alphaproteobacteria bacterium]
MRYFIVLNNIYKGVFFTFFIALISIVLSNNSFFLHINFSSLTIAIILGMLLGNLFNKPIAKYISYENNGGLAFSQKKLLRLGIILYGFRLTLQQVLDVGIMPLLLDVFVITSIIIIGYNLGTRFFKLSDKLSILIAGGSAICGAAAVLAIDGTIKAKNYETAIAIATVVIFGTISIFAFPYILLFFNLNDYAMGIALGATVHEVAQVVAAGNMINENVAAVAIIVKLTRVMLLLPVIIAVSIFFAKKYKLNQAADSKDNKTTAKIIIETFPWFALGFILMICINSLNIIPLEYINAINVFDNLVLTMAMAALGVGTNFVKIKDVGLKPFALASILMMLLVSYLGLSIYL